MKAAYSISITMFIGRLLCNIQMRANMKEEEEKTQKAMEEKVEKRNNKQITVSIIILIKRQQANENYNIFE